MNTILKLLINNKMQFTNGTPKATALLLYNRYVVYIRENFPYTEKQFEQARQCALIAVDYLADENKFYNLNYCSDDWQEVINEIKKL
jgi:hypothetical protein